MNLQKLGAKVVRGVTLLALSALTLGSVAAVSSAQDRVGTSAAVKGEVFVVPAANRARRTVALQDDFFLQDEVETLVQSTLQILLLDRSTFTVGENANLAIDRFVYDPDTGAGDMAARISKGAFRFMSGRRSGLGVIGASVSTPAAVIGIRGTFFEGVVGEQALRLAQQIGLATGDCGSPTTSLLVALRGAGRRNNTYLNRSGRIVVRNEAGSWTLSESNWAIFVPGPSCRAVGPVPFQGVLREFMDAAVRSAPGGGAFDLASPDVSGEDLAGQDDQVGPGAPDDIDGSGEVSPEAVPND